MFLLFSDISTGVVAFLAKIAAFTGSPSQDTTIPFDVVDLNIGNSYNPDTGAFTTPVSGIYDLSYEAMAEATCGTGHICVELKVNSVGISQSCSVHPNSAGSSVSVQLSSGDTVTVAVDYGASCEVLNDHALFNKFSSHLIYQII